MPPAVLDEDARVGSKRCIGVDDRTGKAPIELRIGLRGIELAQQHLAMSPCQIKDAIRETPILVFFHQAQGCITGFTDAGDHVYRCRFFRIERYPGADGDNRIEHGALAAREQTDSVSKTESVRTPAHRLWIGGGVAAADELHAIGLVGDFSDLRPMHGHQVQHPGRLLAPGAGPASAKYCSLPADDLGLHKEIAERRMQFVRGRRRQDHFRVTGHLDRSACPRAVGDADAAQFDVILGRNSDLRMRVRSHDRGDETPLVLPRKSPQNAPIV